MLAFQTHGFPAVIPVRRRQLAWLKSRFSARTASLTWNEADRVRAANRDHDCFSLTLTQWINEKQRGLKCWLRKSNEFGNSEASMGSIRAARGTVQMSCAILILLMAPGVALAQTK